MNPDAANLSRLEDLAAFLKFASEHVGQPGDKARAISAAHEAAVRWAIEQLTPRTPAKPLGETNG